MAFEALPDTVDERYFRGDSACYETDLLQWLSAEDRHSEPGAVQEVPAADGARGRPDESRRVRDAVTAVRQRTGDLLPQPANPELRALGEDLGLTYTA